MEKTKTREDLFTLIQEILNKGDIAFKSTHNKYTAIGPCGNENNFSVVSEKKIAEIIFKLDHILMGDKGIVILKDHCNLWENNDISEFHNITMSYEIFPGKLRYLLVFSYWVDDPKDDYDVNSVKKITEEYIYNI